MDPMDWTPDLLLVDESRATHPRLVHPLVPRRVFGGREFLRFALASGHPNSISRLAYAMKWMSHAREA